MFQRANRSNLENVFLRDISIKRVNNCVVTRSWLVLTPTGVERASQFDNLPRYRRLYANLVAVGSLCRNPLRRLPDELEYYMPMNSWANSYHHWLSEAALKFVLFENEIKSGKVLVPENRPAFINDFLTLFDFKDIEEVDENVFVKRLNVITNPNSGHYNREHLLKFREAIFSRLGYVRGPARKIYVTRRLASTRKVTNEEEVIDLLSGRGYEVIELEKLAFAEQVRLFADSTSVVSIHGAGLTNAVFMDGNSQLIELYPRYENAERQLNACYYRLCSAIGVKHTFLYCEGERDTKRTDYRWDNITVDLSELSFCSK